MTRVAFTPAQMHVLNMASRIKTEATLQRFKDQMAAFYAKLIDEEMDELWESGEWNEQKLAELRGSHFRTAYK
ncbi:MAG: dephospho-CoA kinase [Bacteroidaceae bacterium]|nr:dephospho-CoA kinase [Bacteroidaceae bacterium]MDO4956042.1 dephospho-CoA kinase [Bacteroidales bacterium]